MRGSRTSRSSPGGSRSYPERAALGCLLVPDEQNAELQPWGEHGSAELRARPASLGIERSRVVLAGAGIAFSPPVQRPTSTTTTLKDGSGQVLSAVTKRYGWDTARLAPRAPGLSACPADPDGYARIA
jgi:hypothetical protein